MPRYFFDFGTGADAVDREGRLLPDYKAAKETALAEARQLIEAGSDRQGEIDLRRRIEVRDQSGEVIFAMHLEDAMR